MESRSVPEYKKQCHQITFFDFNQSCGMQLDRNNEWVLPGDRIDWNSLEEKYAAMFPSPLGHPAKPLRMALGALIIQKRKKLSDRALVAYHPWKKPRTYRRVAGREYLELAGMKKRPAKKIRSTIRKQPGCVKRDLDYLADYMGAGYPLPRKYIRSYLTVLELYRQQKYMFDNRVHQVENRIVSISQPYLRTIVRGRAKTPVEFGAKYDVSMDEAGHARLEKISFDPYNESSIF